MPVSYHVRNCKALLVSSLNSLPLTGALAVLQIFTFLCVHLIDPFTELPRVYAGFTKIILEVIICIPLV